MDRRRVLGGLLALPASSFAVAPSLAAPRAQPYPESSNISGRRTATISLTPSDTVTSHADGQLIENLVVEASFGNGVTVLHRDVTVRNCRIRYAGGHGVHAEGATGLVLHNLEIDHVGAPPSGAGPSELRNCVNLEDCPGATVNRVKASGGSSNIYIVSSEGTRLRYLELHDARGPEPRGQNVQFHRSPNSILEDFSAENGPTSWTEDNISVFRSDRCVVRRGLVSYNNSPTGDGVMIEGSFDCLVEEVDVVQQGNGAFAAVPVDAAGSGGCTFRGCRTRDTYNSERDGRAAPSSDGLSFYMLVSAGARKHTIVDCQYAALSNTDNLIWDERAVNNGWSIRPRMFVPRPPLRLAFDW
jgi:hypothetical protein